MKQQVLIQSLIKIKNMIQNSKKLEIVEIILVKIQYFIKDN